MESVKPGRRRRRQRKFRKLKISVPKNVRRYVKKQIAKETETKYWDTYNSAVAFDYNGNVVSLSEVAQGTTDVTRIGDKIMLRSLTMNLIWGAADNSNVGRFVVLQWYPNTTLVAPSVATILNASTSVLAPQSPFIHDYENQFGILYDSMQTSVLAETNGIVSTRIKVPLKYAKKTIEYTAATTAGSNKLYFLYISDSAAVTHPTMNYYFRLYFDDA